MIMTEQSFLGTKSAPRILPLEEREQPRRNSNRSPRHRNFNQDLPLFPWLLHMAIPVSLPQQRCPMSSKGSRRRRPRIKKGIHFGRATADVGHHESDSWRIRKMTGNTGVEQEWKPSNLSIIWYSTKCYSRND